MNINIKDKLDFNKLFIIVLFINIIVNLTVHFYPIIVNGKINVSPDGRLYLDISKSIRNFTFVLDGTYLSTTKGIDFGGEIMPGYPLLISPFCENLHIIPIFQVLLFSFAIFLLLKVIYNKFLIIFSFLALLELIISTSWDYHNMPLIESSTISFVCFMIYFLDKYFKDFNYKDFIYFSIIFGILISINNRFIFHYCGFIPFLLLLKYFERRISVKHLITSILIVAAILTPWHIRQYIVYGKFVLFSPLRSDLYNKKQKQDDSWILDQKALKYREYLLDTNKSELAKNKKLLEECKTSDSILRFQNDTIAKGRLARGEVKPRYQKNVRTVYEPAKKEIVGNVKEDLAISKNTNKELVQKRENLLGIRSKSIKSEGQTEPIEDNVRILKYNADKNADKNVNNIKSRTIQNKNKSVQSIDKIIAQKNSKFINEFFKSLNINSSNKSVLGLITELNKIKNQDSIKYFQILSAFLSSYKKDNLLQNMKSKKEIKNNTSSTPELNKNDLASKLSKTSKEDDFKAKKQNTPKSSVVNDQSLLSEQYPDTLKILINQIESTIKLTSPVLNEIKEVQPITKNNTQKSNDLNKEINHDTISKIKEKIIDEVKINQVRKSEELKLSEFITSILNAKKTNTNQLSIFNNQQVTAKLNKKLLNLQTLNQQNQFNIDTQIVISKRVFKNPSATNNLNQFSNSNNIVTDTLVILKKETKNNFSNKLNVNSKQISFDTIKASNGSNILKSYSEKLPSSELNYQDENFSVTIKDLKVQQLKVSSFENELEFKKFENIRIQKMVPTYNEIIEALSARNPELLDPERIGIFLKDFSYEKYKTLVYAKSIPTKYSLIWDRFIDQFVFYNIDFRLMPQWDPRIYAPSHYYNIVFLLLDIIMLPLIIINIIPLVIAIKKRNWLIISFAIFIFLHIFLHALVGYIPRYRITIYPVWITFAVYGYDQLTRYIIHVYKNKVEYKQRVYKLISR